MGKPIEQSSQRNETERRAHEIKKLQACLDQTNWSDVDEAAKCREAVPESRLLEMRDLPTRLEGQEAPTSPMAATSHEKLVESKGKTKWQQLVEGATEARNAYLREHPIEAATISSGQEHLEEKKTAVQTGQDLAKIRENRESLRRLEKSEGNEPSDRKDEK